MNHGVLPAASDTRIADCSRLLDGSWAAPERSGKAQHWGFVPDIALAASRKTRTTTANQKTFLVDRQGAATFSHY
jgi:hypothetical protein